MDWYIVAVAALATALATGLGALPFLAREHVPDHGLGLAQAVAAGLMLTASYRLIQEGLVYGTPRTVGGVVAGLVLIVWSQARLSDRQELTVGELRGADAMKAILVVGVMTMHSFAEGMGVGVSFGGGETFGFFVTAAIAVHNIPEGLAIAAVLVPRGVSVGKSALWSVVSSLPQPLVAIPAFLLVSIFEPALPVGLGVAGGAMIWMVFSELIPEALEHSTKESVATATTAAAAAMIVMQWLLGG